eukprot:2784271-Pleurochrysis_carterae.AAC.5
MQHGVRVASAITNTTRSRDGKIVVELHINTPNEAYKKVQREQHACRRVEAPSRIKGRVGRVRRAVRSSRRVSLVHRACPVWQRRMVPVHPLAVNAWVSVPEVKCSMGVDAATVWGCHAKSEKPRPTRANSRAISEAQICKTSS